MSLIEDNHFPASIRLENKPKGHKSNDINYGNVAR